MTKKRNKRQPNPNVDQMSSGTYDESCENVKAETTGCLHIAKAVNLHKIKRNLKKTGLASICPLCTKQIDNLSKTDQKHDVSKPLWICLQCGEQHCDKEQHALEHYKKPHSDCHYMIIETQSWNVWCYQCEAEIPADFRKKLLETVEFIKKFSTVPHIVLPTKTPSVQHEKQIINPTDEIQKIEKQLPKVVGLSNLGNTCFFNAVLQCLAQTPYLVKVLDDLRLPGKEFVLPGGTHKLGNSEEIDLPPIKGTLERWGSFTSVFCETLSNIQTAKDRQIYNPIRLFEKLKKKTTQCVDGGQHDSHEFLRHLLEIVRTEDLRRYQSIILKEVGLSEKTNPDRVEKNLKSRVRFYGNQANMRSLGPGIVFNGVLVSTLECLECHNCSRRTEPFLDLSLPVRPDKLPSIFRRENDQIACSIRNTPLRTTEERELPESSCNQTKSTDLRLSKRALRKNRKNKRREKHKSFDMQLNDLIQDDSSTKNHVRKSDESDADTEDNIELENINREAKESGYSSGKQSTSNSPISLANDYSNETRNLGVNDSNVTILISPTAADLSIENKELSGDRTSQNVDTNDYPNPEDEASSDALSLCIMTDSEVTSSEDVTAKLNNYEEISSDTIITEVMKRPESAETNDEKKSNNDSIEDSTTKQSLCKEINNITEVMSNLDIAGHQLAEKYCIEEGEPSIHMCLNDFTALELLTGSNKVTCEVCTSRQMKGPENSSKSVRTTSSKQLLISKVPPVLILHLKRFQTHRMSFRKVFKHIKFPMLLDLAPICIDKCKQPRLYALYGVVEHSGNIHGGHYVAYVKTRMPLASDDPRWEFLNDKDSKTNDNLENISSSDSNDDCPSVNASVQPPSGEWYLVSDSRVTQVDEETVLRSQAYLLFYERIL